MGVKGSMVHMYIITFGWKVTRETREKLKIKQVTDMDADVSTP